MNRIPWNVIDHKYRASRTLVKSTGLVLGLLLFCVPTFAQLNLGRINGGVTDQTGGAIANATVTVVDVDRGASRILTTDTGGEYNAPSLTPGKYTVRAEASGFQTTLRENVLVGVGQELRVDLTLRTGEQTQTVTVSEDVLMVNTTSSELGGNIETRDLGDLPINGRSYAKLLNFTPGAVSVNGNDTFYNGVRYTQNEWMFDGIDDLNDANTGPMIGGTSGFTEATILPADAIQEVHLATNGKAEYGWKPGGAINIGIKSGTNTLHGTAFALGRNSSLEAKDPFGGGAPAPDQITQQGATLGGPIKKDKLFFFTAYEGQSFHLQTSSTDQVPASLASAAGTDATDNVPDALYDIYKNTNNFGAGKPNLPASLLSLDLMGCKASPASIQAAATGAANAAAGAKAIEGLCYPGGAGSIVSIFNNPTSSVNSTVSPASSGGSQNGLAKLDYHLSDHNLFNGEFFFGEGPMIQAAGQEVQQYWATARWTRTQAVRGVWTWLPNSTWVNEARIGYDRQHKSSIPADCFTDLGQPDYAAQYHLVTGVTTPLVPLGTGCAFPGLAVGSFQVLGGNTGSGAQDNTIYHIAGIDSVSYTHGTHQFKFGFEMHRNHLYGASKLSNGSGMLTFGTSPAAFTGAKELENFLTGTVSSSALLVGNALVNVNWPRYALFGQDDWRITRKLTVNLGLRWEIIPAPNEQDNKLGTFDPSLGLAQVGNQLSALYPTKHNAIEPRVGFAYDLTGKGTTVVRGGFGIGYSFNNFNEYLSISQGAASNTVPTGWNIVAADGTVLPKPGNMVAGNLTAPNGSLVTWLPDTPIFNQNTNLLACGNGLSGHPQPCDIQVVNTHLKAGSVLSWNLSAQHAFGSNLALTVAYVGTHGRDLNGLRDSNLPVPGSASTAAEQLRRPYTQNCPATVPGGLGLDPSKCFPYLGKVYVYGQGGWSNYHGLQMSVQQRVTHGLFFTAAYTFSHSLDTSSADFGSPVMDSRCLQCDYGRSSFDFRHNFTLRFVYNVPGVKRAPAQLLEGWQVSSAIAILSGQPLTGTDSSTDLSGTGQKLDRWSIAGDPKNIQTGFGIPCYSVTGIKAKFDKAPCTTVPVGTSTQGTAAFVANLPQACIDAAAGEATNPTVVAGGLAGSLDYNGLAALAHYGCYLQNGTAIVPPAQGTYGNMSRNLLSNGLPYREWDASISKTWKITERFSTQFRTDIFNVTNNVIYQAPKSNPNSVTSFGLSTALNRSGDPILGNGGPRQITLGLKIMF